jgi:roundabout, axon guidance receptor 2
MKEILLLSSALAGKPQIVEQTDNSVTISWVRSNKVGASSLLGYTVEMFGRNDTDGWMTVAYKVPNTTHQQVGLKNDITYYFIVRAENSHGVSIPSAVSEPVNIGRVSIAFIQQPSPALLSILLTVCKSLS